MSIEADFRKSGQVLQTEFALVSRMIKEGELKMANEELAFAQNLMNQYIEKIESKDNKKVGIPGLIFRHPYHVPEEFKKIAIAMDKESKRLTGLLRQKMQAEKNLADRAAARERKQNAE